jgi:2-methylcitrate dehydratase PrpD
MSSGKPPAVEDASAAVARSSVALQYDDLSPPVIDAAKRSILDTLGVCMAATGAAPDVAPVQAVTRLLAAPGGVRALGYGWSLPTLDAVFWLGALSHALDFDDYADIVHPSAPVISAILPLAQAGPPLDGRTAIAAVALGQDFIIRIALAVRRSVSDYGWLPSLPGAMGATLASAKVLGLDEKQTQNAIGLVLHQTGATMQALAESGSAFRAIREGFSARSGVVSAQLAAAGMLGDEGSLDGKFGLFGQFFQGDYDRDFLLRGLGEDLKGPITTYKAWPSAGHTHLYVTALDELLTDPTVRPADIKRVRVAGGGQILQHQCEPRGERIAPARGIDAKVSIPFLLGKRLARGSIRISDFHEDGLHDPEAIAYAELVEWRIDPALRKQGEGFGPGRVELELADGRTVSTQVAHGLGHPDLPLSWEQLVAKFEDCLEASAVRVSRPAIDEVVEAVAGLENLDDVSVLVDLLTPALADMAAPAARHAS